MEATRNLCAQVPLSLHERVTEERIALGKSLTIMATAMKTLAFQIPEELDQRIKKYLAAEKERTGKKLSQREFIVGLIEQALDAHETADTAE